MSLHIYESIIPPILSKLTHPSLPIHLLEPNGYIGVWVTNKPAFRTLLLGEDGLFDHWDVELVEEWIWVKVTTNGEPISDIEGTWRKPWEVLLVGRKKNQKSEVGSNVRSVQEASRKKEDDRKPEIKDEEKGEDRENNGGEEDRNKHTPRRIITGVSDLHSRKPNLRYLFGQMIGRESYSGLEVFARSLTAGWWGWGDEVGKFQMDEEWTEESEREQCKSEGVGGLKKSSQSMGKWQRGIDERETREETYPE